MPGQEKRAIFVLGMHRSGTSAMARVLGLCGFALPLRLMEPNFANPTGYWEPIDATVLDDAVLADLDSSWSDPFGPRHHRTRRLFGADHLSRAREVLRENFAEQSFIVFKDPRASLLVELWRSAAEAEGFEPHFVIMVRHPLSVAQSLAAREGVSRNRALILWATYMLAAETATRPDKRAFVGFGELFGRPEAVLDKLEAAFGFAFPRRTWAAVSDVEAYLKADLIHQRSTGTIDGAHFRPLADFYAFLEGATRGEKQNADVPGDTAAWLESLEETLGPILKQAETSPPVAANDEALRQQVAGLRAQLHDGAAAVAARIAAIAAASEQRRAELVSERDAAIQKAQGLQRDLMARLEESGRQIERARERIVELEGEADTSRRRAGVEGTRLREATEREALAAARVDALASELAVVRRDLAAARSDHARSTAKAQTENEALADRVSVLQARGKDAQRAWRRAQRTLNRQLALAQAAAEAAEQEAVALDASLQRARREAADTASELTRAQENARTTADEHAQQISILATQSREQIATRDARLAEANQRPIRELQGLVLKRAVRIVRRRLGFASREA